MITTLDLHWSFDPTIIIGLLIATTLYGVGAMRALSRFGSHSTALPRLITFLSGILAITIALLSPLDSLSDQLFSAHMAQHVLLMDVAAPLLILSHPLTGFLLGLPSQVRHSIGYQWAHNDRIRRIWGWITQPAAAWTFYACVIWIWHIPALYSLAIEDIPVHALEHLSYLIASMLFWWVVLEWFHHRRRTRVYSGVLFILSFGLQSGLLGAILSASTRPWYPYYADLSLPTFTPLADQQLAGLVMMATDGLIYPVAALLLLRVGILRNRLKETQDHSPSSFPEK